MDAVDADRLVARGVTFSAVFAGALGVLLLFAPDEVGGLLMPLPGAAVLVQLLAATLLGFGVLNWIGRHHKLGGIYGRAIVAANQMHFTVGALVLVNHGVRAGGSPAYWALSAIYVAFAVFFSQLLYGWRLPFRSGRLP
jgi:hypothetical protein